MWIILSGENLFDDRGIDPINVPEVVHLAEVITFWVFILLPAFSVVFARSFYLEPWLCKLGWSNEIYWPNFSLRPIYELFLFVDCSKVKFCWLGKEKFKAVYFEVFYEVWTRAFFESINFFYGKLFKLRSGRFLLILLPYLSF